jgi:hypothetical protein
VRLTNAPSQTPKFAIFRGNDLNESGYVVGIEATDCHPHKANSIMAHELAAPFWFIKVKEIQSFND